MDSVTKCPFCGGQAAIKRPKLDLLKKVGGKAYGFEGYVETRRLKDVYYKCNGCMMEYVCADREIESILAGLEVGDSIQGRIKQYYNEDVSVVDLLTEYSTGMVRKANNYLSFISTHVVKDELIICFRYKKVRTFGTFIKRSRKGSNEVYYLFDELNKA